MFYYLPCFLWTPGQTDLPEEGLEATLKAITLIEDFSAFDAQLPPVRYSCLLASYTLSFMCLGFLYNMTMVLDVRSGLFTNVIGETFSQQLYPLKILIIVFFVLQFQSNYYQLVIVWYCEFWMQAKTFWCILGSPIVKSNE